MGGGLNLRRLLALLMAVAVLHWLAMGWLGAQLPQAGSMQALGPVMFTREIAPAPPMARTAAPSPPAPAAKPKPRSAGKKSTRSAITNIAKSMPQSAPTAPAEAPLAAAPAPDPLLIPPAAEPLAEASPTASTSALASSTSATSRWQDIWPESTRLSYKAGGYFRGELHGRAVVQWQLQGEQYRTDVVVNIGPITALKMSSQGRITPEGLYPQAYEETELGTRRLMGLPDDAVVLGNGMRVPRVPQVQDSASQFVELAFRLLSGRDKLEVGQVIRYTLARPDGVDEWVYDVVEETTLDTPRWGPLKAFHLKPRPLARPRGPIVMETWYAPSLDYLPVRIKVLRGATSHMDLLIDNAMRGEPPPPAAPATPATERERP
jgi:Protein of unknown function (DUF3108)